MQFSIVFWNTGLLHIKEDERDYQTCIDLLEGFLEKNDIDVLALCEVDEEAISKISTEARKHKYKVMSAVDEVASRNKFDMCVLFNKSVSKVEKKKGLYYSESNRNYRVGQEFELIFKDSYQPIFLYVCHWRSRIHGDELVRNKCGSELKRRIDKNTVFTKNPYTIIVGDFNDEPFNDSLQEYLRATRDIHIIEDKQDLLYNPSWNTFGTRNIDTEQYFAGTYFYNNGSLTNWHNFDQIIVSSAFLQRNGGWKLCNEKMEILEIPWYLRIVKDKKTKYDHLPVYCMFESDKTVEEKDTVRYV